MDLFILNLLLILNLLQLIPTINGGSPRIHMVYIVVKVGYLFASLNLLLGFSVFAISEVKDLHYLVISSFGGIQPSPYSVTCNTSLRSGKSEHHYIANIYCVGSIYSCFVYFHLLFINFKSGYLFTLPISRQILIIHLQSPLPFSPSISS